MANSTLAQINRQKSARNLFVREFDPIAKRAVLYDPKREQTHTPTLSSCDCVDFQRLKTVARPCMHIYRVAAELGLITLDHMDRGIAARVDTEEREKETKRLQLLLRDKSQWGDWAREIHEAHPRLCHASGALLETVYATGKAVRMIFRKY